MTVEEQADAPRPFDTWVLLYPSVGRVEGLPSRALGRTDRGANHFESALAVCRKAGYRPELAWASCDYAEMLGEPDGSGDGRKATALLDESLAISRELGTEATEGANAIATVDTGGVTTSAFVLPTCPKCPFGKLVIVGKCDCHE